MTGDAPRGIGIGPVGPGGDAQIGAADRAGIDVEHDLALSCMRPGPFLQLEQTRAAIGKRLHQATLSLATSTGRPSNHDRLDARTAATAARPSAAPTSGTAPASAVLTKLASSPR